MSARRTSTPNEFNPQKKNQTNTSHSYSIMQSNPIQQAGTPQSTAKSVLHQYFASMGGDSLAQMALGHRHLFGLGVPKSCQSAALFYDPPASRVSDLIAASIGPSTGSAFEKTRLSTETEGQREDSLVKREVQVAQYYQYSADMGNADAASAVGRLLNAGARGVKADRKSAYKYFTQAAAAGDADALAHLGHMWANGIGVSPNNKTALALFHKAAEKGNARAIYGLGYMYLSGYGVARDVGKAVDFFTNAAEQGFADAQFHLGALYARGVVPVGDEKDHTNKGKGDAKGDTKGDKNTQAQKKDHAKAFYNFNLAAAQGHAVATYNLAMMQLSGSLGLPQTCNAATLLLKGLAERGEWTRSIEEARVNVASVKRKKTGLLRYMKLAEAGIEVAQANAAFILDRSERWYDDEMEEDVPISGVVPTTVGTPSREHRALHYHRLAADQGNVFSLLKIGDAYFYGKGVNDRMSKQSEGDLTSLKPSIELSRQNKNTSAAVYLQASQHRSAQAMFNLGLMHEHGVGLPKDLHLAKRYYDMALSTDPKAFVPVKLALWKLKMHTWLELKARESALVGKGVKWLHRVMGVVFLSDVGFEEDLETDNETDYSHETNNLSNEQKKNGSSKDFDTVALKVLAALLGAVVLARFGVGLGFAAPRGGAEAETAVETNREITGVETTTAETTGEETTAIDTVADPLDPDPTTS